MRNMRRQGLAWRAAAVLFVLAGTSLAAAESGGGGGLGPNDWPQFRGPTGQGITGEKDLPTKWGGSDGQNVLWKAPLAASHNPWSSPVIAGDTILFTSCKMEGQEQHVLAFSKADGKPLWDTPIPPGPWKGAEPKGGLADPTPCTDGRNVYAVFGSAVIVCLDMQGKIVWRKEFPAYNFDVTVGSCPILYKNLILYQADQYKKTSSLFAYDRATGDVKWEDKRPEVTFAHSTPILLAVGGKTQLIVSGSTGLMGVDPDEGKRIWWCKGAGETASPVYGGGLVYADTGRGSGGLAVDPTGQGDVTATHLKWKVELGSELSSPVVAGDCLYRLCGTNLVCLKLATGEKVWSQKLEGISAWASPIVTPEGNIYCASSGTSFIIKAGPKCEILATNNLGDPNHAAPAISDGKIYLRGTKFLYCVGKK